jgi:succinoglycan biosynthesis protein ExoH
MMMRPNISVSGNIDAWRFLLITLVVYNHSFSLYNNIEGADLRSSIDYAITTVTRTAVPALSVFSGYLLVTRNNYSYVELVWKKFNSLILPLLAWNTIPFIVFLALNETLWFAPDMLFRNLDVGRLADLSLALNGSPANGPLYFLRDLFICFLIFAAVRRWMRTTLGIVIALAATGINYKFDLTGVLIIRNTIPLFFVIGMGWHRVLRFENITKSDAGVTAAISVIVVAICTLYPEAAGEGSWISLIAYLTLARLVISSIYLIPMFEWLSRWGREYSFTIFLSHWMVLKALLVIWKPLGLPGLTFELLAPLAAIPAGICIKVILNLMSNSLAGVVTGGREGSQMSISGRVPRPAERAT